MTLIDGKATSLTIQEELAAQTQAWVEAGHRAPHLAAVIVGDNPASRVYVGHKIKACARVGFHSTLVELSENIRQDELLDEIHQLNKNPDIDGFIVQLPLPQHIDAKAVIAAIDPMKDVDGFHPTNLGNMTLGLPAFVPATPAGVIELLKRHEIETAGKQAVIIGRSHIVGTPLAVLLSRPGMDATVTLCHSRTQNLSDLTRQADLLIAAVGRTHMVTADMVKPGATVIDVGMNTIADATRKSGRRLTGDVDFEGVKEKASAITPVPGGVGPMTIAALLMNTMQAAIRE